MRKIELLLVLVLSSAMVRAEEYATNARAEQVERTMVITYDLSQTTNVRLLVATNMSNDFKEVKKVTGAVGENVQAGANRQITWNVLEEYDRFVADGVRFKVETYEAASERNDSDVIFVVVETMPEFPGGAQAMMRFITENIIYPVEAAQMGIQGRAICQFVVEKDGSISNVVVIRSSGDRDLDNEAIRVVQSMPQWKPGKQRGVPVRVKYTIPVSFRL